MPRILALLPFLVKGALSIEIFRALRARGVEITVAFCSDASATYEPDPMDDFRNSGHLLDLSKASGAERFKLIDELVSAKPIDLLLQVGATDLYHLLPYWKEKRPNLRIADILYNEFGHTLNHFLYEGCIDAVIVESDFMRDFVRRSTAKPEARVEIVHSGVDVEEFSPDETRETTANLKVGYVGRMSAEKNPRGFIDLAERLGAMNANLEFDMFGGGADAGAIKERVEKSSLGGRLSYHGFIGHSRDALRQLDVLIVPSKFDGRPVSIMEANACGIPVIAAPVGGIPELVCDGVNGFLLQPGESERIHALLAQWQQQPESLAKQKRVARAYALEHFDRLRMIEAYAAAFTRIATC